MNIRFVAMTMTFLSFVSFQYGGLYDHLSLTQEIKNNPCPPEVRIALDKDIAANQGLFSNEQGWFFNGSMSLHSSRAYKLDALPDFYFKQETHRLIGAAIMRDAITKKGLNLLRVPDKFACTYNNAPWIAAKKISGFFENKPFNLEQTKQLCSLILKTWACDLHRGNVMNMNDGSVAIVDTKLSRFAATKSERINGLWRIYNGSWLSLPGLKTDVRIPLDEDAREYVKQQIENEESRLKTHECYKRQLEQEQSFDLLKTYEQSRTRDYVKMVKN